MEVEHCKNLIIGSGEAGKSLAWAFGRQGEKCVVVERGLLGGACPNVACLPSKNIVHSAKVASLAAGASDLGINFSTAATNMAGVFERKRKMVAGLHDLHMANFVASGADVIYGEAQFTAPLTVRITLNNGGERHIRAERVFLNLGSRAAIPNVPGMRVAQPLTHVEALDLQRKPKHLVVLGGGYVGLELAQAMRRFGSEVTVIQRGPRLLDKEDPEVSDALLQLFKDEGITVRLGASVVRVSGKSGDSVTLDVKDEHATSSIEATDILAAAGRTPNTDRFGAAAGGVELDARGFIRVDDKLRTTAPNVYAMGDCAGSPHFTHVAFDDYLVVRDNLAGKDRTTRGRLIPYVLFTDPELAHVGLSETEAKSQGIPYRAARVEMAQILRTRTLAETRGFAKILLAPDDLILGFTAIGPDVSEMMGMIQIAMIGKVPYTALADAVFTHPTMGEGVGVLCRKALADQQLGGRAK